MEDPERMSEAALPRPPAVDEVDSALDRAVRAVEDLASAKAGARGSHLEVLRERVRELGEVASAAAAAAGSAEEARERAQAESQAKDDFLSLLSHELRTPVGGVLIWTQLLRTAGDDQAAAEKAADMIERSTRALVQLMNDLLDASRLVAGRLLVEVRPVDLEGVVAAAVEAALPAAQAKRVRLDRVAGSRTTEVAGDPARLQQVVGNLLSNAVKFSPEGGRIEVRVEEGLSSVRVEVQDEGPGIDPGLLPTLFDARRRRRAGSPDRGGLGLGLTIARHLAELHHGSLEVTSSGPGMGSTFTLALPVTVRQDRGLAVAAMPAGSTHPDETAGSVEGLRVLLVDDEEGARAALSTVLELLGARVTAVSSCREALAQLDRQAPDILLSDIAMPVEDGYDLIRLVRRREDASAVLPAVAVTAYAGVEHRQRALHAGFDEHVAKPVDPDHLVRVIARVASSPGKMGT